jgi:hypothetical protein
MITRTTVPVSASPRRKPASGASTACSSVSRRGVEHELVGDPLEGHRRLHHTDGDLVPLQVLLEAVRMADEHGIRERLGVVRREAHVLLPCELQHGLRPDTAVEVDVQLGFG